MKADEANLLVEIYRLSMIGEHAYVRQIAIDLGMHPKRAAYICQKWSDKGWYEYGVNVLAGWLTESGKDAAAIYLISTAPDLKQKAWKYDATAS